MIKLFKKLLGGKEEDSPASDPPGRTFKRILTGRYFGCENKEAGTEEIQKAKQSKIDKIRELELEPMFLRYTYEVDNDLSSKVASAHVAFQKEIFAQKWNMVHVTEVSFIVESTEFEEFEKMAGVSLEKDFRNLTTVTEHTYKGKERRKRKREG